MQLLERLIHQPALTALYPLFLDIEHTRLRVVSAPTDIVQDADHSVILNSELEWAPRWGQMGSCRTCLTSPTPRRSFRRARLILETLVVFSVADGVAFERQRCVLQHQDQQQAAGDGWVVARLIPVAVRNQVVWH